MGILTDQLELRKNMNTQSTFGSLHCLYNKKLSTTRMPNNKSYKLNTTIMSHDHEKRGYKTGVSEGIKKFSKVL